MVIDTVIDEAACNMSGERTRIGLAFVSGLADSFSAMKGNAHGGYLAWLIDVRDF